MPIVIAYVSNKRQIKETEIGASYLQRFMNFKSYRINSGLLIGPSLKKKRPRLTTIKSDVKNVFNNNVLFTTRYMFQVWAG